MPIALQIPCNTLHFFPKTAENLKKICAAAGLNVFIPDEETCCGLPYFEKGENKAAKSIGEYNLKLYGQNQLLCTSPKCRKTLDTHYPKIFNNTVSHNETLAMVRNISDLKDVLKRLPQDNLEQITGNYFLVRECSSDDAPLVLPSGENLIWHSSYMAKTCCGAGASLPCSDSKMSELMAGSLIDEYKSSGAQAMVFEDDICRKHVQNVADRMGLQINTFNIIDIIASVL